ncbi:hypothetical protein HH_1566 [Helicobacter hepaticus ATCC 51449]|uniref:Uncharacterized protein n=1 Tax=Helicobacter hepaticus (strain ATCC 51449 / 3B1) TaxID=235279 RepID=Q7VFV9_HELHP|nr:hypothetical protein HH_1566 [Helicobacter hepaticus ATCC 51449]
MSKLVSNAVCAKRILYEVKCLGDSIKNNITM